MVSASKSSRERVRAWKRAHPARAREIDRGYEQRNRERIAARKSAYNKTHRAEARARKKRWQKANPEKYRAMLRRQYASAKARGFHAKRREKDQVGYLLAGAKSRAKKRGLEFSLTRADIIIPEFCPVLGIAIYKGKKHQTNKNSPSIDRIDNAKGYTRDNVKIISLRANRLKSDASVAELVLILAYMQSCGLPGNTMGGDAEGFGV